MRTKVVRHVTVVGLDAERERIARLIEQRCRAEDFHGSSEVCGICAPNAQAVRARISREAMRQRA